MSFRVFVLPDRGDESAEQALNGFLANHTVLSIERRWSEERGYWTLLVDFVAKVTRPSPQQANSSKPKIDYREVLPPEEFAVYARLRDLRKELAAAEGVPLYKVFTNDQLAQMVRNRADSRAALARIDGVGEAKVDKYGERLLEALGVPDGHELATAQPR